MFKKISEGDVVLAKPGKNKPAGSRIAVLPDGKLACTFNVKERTESNDCITMICYSDDGENWGEPHVKLLPDGTLIACLWYDSGEKKGIRYVKLAIEE